MKKINTERRKKGTKIHTYRLNEKLERMETKWKGKETHTYELNEKLEKNENKKKKESKSKLTPTN